MIVGTWQIRADWEQWHHDPEFTEARRRLDEMTDGPTDPGWHEVVAEVRKGRAASKGRSTAKARS